MKPYTYTTLRRLVNGFVRRLRRRRDEVVVAIANEVAKRKLTEASYPGWDEVEGVVDYIYEVEHIVVEELMEPIKKFFEEEVIPKVMDLTGGFFNPKCVYCRYFISGSEARKGLGLKLRRGEGYCTIRKKVVSKGGVCGRFKPTKKPIFTKPP